MHTSLACECWRYWAATLVTMWSARMDGWFFFLFSTVCFYIGFSPLCITTIVTMWSAWRDGWGLKRIFLNHWWEGIIHPVALQSFLIFEKIPPNFVQLWDFHMFAWKPLRGWLEYEGMYDQTGKVIEDIGYFVLLSLLQDVTYSNYFKLCSFKKLSKTLCR